ncbi:undecaprenyl-diphosphate phosphatase [Aeromicrobium sp.]|nr:undecaprenyl-diphosphate phosphatase [Candidatus Saccharibacteria bacterium]
MGIIEAIVLGIIEGITEFLPVSSTGHLTIAEKLLGQSINDPAVTAFTAVIQIGAIAAAIVFLRKDIVRIITGWVRGVFMPALRTTQDYKFGWAVILGSIPIAVIGLLFKDQIETTLRSLWFVAIALIGWSAVMWAADKYATTRKREDQTTWRDTVIIGFVQCIALIPGVSRSGATISAGLFRGFDRVAATRLSFFLGIPALVAAGALEAVTKASDISSGVGWPATIVATVVSFIVAYLSIAWLLKYVARHTFKLFIVYRIVVGVLLIVLLATGTIAST